MLNKIIFQLGTRRRNPSLPRHLRFLLNSDRWSAEQLAEYQLARCKALLLLAEESSPYYRTLFKQFAFDPAQFSRIEDLKRIPILEKADLLACTDEIHTQKVFRRCFHSETSGTSGQVLKFFRNEEWESGHRAAIFRGYHWHGVNPWDRNGYFWGYNLALKSRARIQILDALQNRFRVFSYREEEIVAFARKLRSAVYLHGYSSMIYEVAKIVNRMGAGGQSNLKMIKGTSEKVYESYQDEVEKAFGRRIINEYGACETGVIAFECPQGSMHICSENVIVEEEGGEIIVTNLLSESFPIIRYRLGDAVKLAPSEYRCDCGRAHPVILDVLGRVGKTVEGAINQYPSLTFYYVFKNLALSRNIALNYQAVQEKKGEVILKIEQTEDGSAEALGEELRKYFQNDVVFHVQWGQPLHAMDGKLKDFVTHLQ